MQTEREWEMSNVVEQLTPNPVNHKHGENGCCKNPRAWEVEMMHQVWAAGLHDAANCFQDALEAKWKLKSQQKVKPKTNSDRIRAMTDEELANFVATYVHCEDCWIADNCLNCGDMTCYDNILSFLRSPVEDSEK